MKWLALLIPPGLLCAEARARRVESGITLQFLRSLRTAIDREISNARESVPTVSIDSETNNFVNAVPLGIFPARRFLRFETRPFHRSFEETRQ